MHNFVILGFVVIIGNYKKLISFLKGWYGFRGNLSKIDNLPVYCNTFIYYGYVIVNILLWIGARHAIKWSIFKHKT